MLYLAILICIGRRGIGLRRRGGGGRGRVWSREPVPKRRAESLAARGGRGGQRQRRWVARAGAAQTRIMARRAKGLLWRARRGRPPAAASRARGGCGAFQKEARREPCACACAAAGSQARRRAPGIASTAARLLLPPASDSSTTTYNPLCAARSTHNSAPHTASSYTNTTDAHSSSRLYTPQKLVSAPAAAPAAPRLVSLVAHNSHTMLPRHHVVGHDDRRETVIHQCLPGHAAFDRSQSSADPSPSGLMRLARCSSPSGDLCTDLHRCGCVRCSVVACGDESISPSPAAIVMLSAYVALGSQVEAAREPAAAALPLAPSHLRLACPHRTLCLCAAFSGTHPLRYSQ